MQISSLSGTFQAMFFQDEQSEKRTRPLEQGEKRGDTVSFSEEAISLARKMTSQTFQSGNASSEESDEEKAKKGLFATDSTGIILNGMQASEADLAKEIQKVQEEVETLYQELETIMEMEADIEEKLRLSEPTNKELKDKLETLGALKGMQQAMKMNKRAAEGAKDITAAGV